MDIKTAFLTAGSRKRKAPSPQASKNELKIIKLNKELNDNEDDVEIIGDACNVAITLDKSVLESSPGDCKENKDINSSKNIDSSLCDVTEDKNCNLAKEELASHANKTSVEDKLKSLSNVKSIETNSFKDLEPSLSEKTDNSSCDELNSSAVNSSVNVSLNTSGLSMTGDDAEEKNTSSDAKVTETISSNKVGDQSNEIKKVKKKVIFILFV